MVLHPFLAWPPLPTTSYLFFLPCLPSLLLSFILFFSLLLSFLLPFFLLPFLEDLRNTNHNFLVHVTLFTTGKGRLVSSV